MRVCEIVHLAFFIPDLSAGGVARERLTTIYNPVVTPDLHTKAHASLDHPWFPPDAPPVVLGTGRAARTTLRLANWRGCFKSGERGPLRGKIGPHVRQVLRRVGLGPPQTLDGGHFDQG